ncbi:MAG: 2Fe-2S iron-sulfur cluster binding domain-containing protein [Clostridiales Family XIII bacterium]|jgi:ferredoxin|nr:2Fe-2S iron-sulfur cluster binding domain-containing protein [Clostridiales Family XIII bacterium]
MGVDRGAGAGTVARTVAKVFRISITDGSRQLYSYGCRADEPLLNGIWRLRCREIPRGCAGGGCGVCKIRVEQGEMTVFKPMSRAHITEEEERDGIVLACCTMPASDMVVRFCPAVDRDTWQRSCDGRVMKGQ